MIGERNFIFDITKMGVHHHHITNANELKGHWINIAEKLYAKRIHSKYNFQYDTNTEEFKEINKHSNSIEEIIQRDEYVENFYKGIELCVIDVDSNTQFEIFKAVIKSGDRQLFECMTQVFSDFPDNVIYVKVQQYFIDNIHYLLRPEVQEFVVNFGDNFFVTDPKTSKDYNGDYMNTIIAKIIFTDHKNAESVDSKKIIDKKGLELLKQLNKDGEFLQDIIIEWTNTFEDDLDPYISQNTVCDTEACDMNTNSITYGTEDFDLCSCLKKFLTNIVGNSQSDFDEVFDIPVEQHVYKQHVYMIGKGQSC